MADDKILSWQETPIRKTVDLTQPSKTLGFGQPKFARDFLDKVNNAALDYLEPVTTKPIDVGSTGPVYGSYDDLVERGLIKKQPTQYAKGGKVRGDGCCKRGKTKGRFV